MIRIGSIRFDSVAIGRMVIKTPIDSTLVSVPFDAALEEISFVIDCRQPPKMTREEFVDFWAKKWDTLFEKRGYEQTDV